MIRLAAFLILVFATSGVHAQCFKDAGRKNANSFGPASQLTTLKAQVKNKNCSVYGLSWSVAARGGKTEKGILIFNTETGELIKARSIPKGDKRALEAESWTSVTKASLERDQPADGISQRHYMKLDTGASMVLSDETAQFMKQRKLSGFLTGAYLTAGISSDPDVEVEIVEPGDSGTVAALAPAKTESAPAREESAAAAPAAPDEAHQACLQKVAASGETPSPEAKASAAACDEELQIIEGRRAALSAKQSRFDDLLTAHVTG